MKKNLIKTSVKTYHIVDGIRVGGVHDGIYGDLTGNCVSRLSSANAIY